jgi:hypothetical protein
LGKQRVVCGFSWLLQVIDHAAALLGPNLFSSLVHRSVVLLKQRFGRQTSSRWLFSRKNDWVVQVVLHHAIKAVLVLSAQKIVTGRQELGCHFLLFTTALSLHGGVLLAVERRAPRASYTWAWNGA